MLDVTADREEAQPVIMLARLLGKLRIAGLDTRTISYVTILMNSKDIHVGRRFCIRMADVATLNVSYVVMVPWNQRDIAFDHICD